MKFLRRVGQIEKSSCVIEPCSSAIVRRWMIVGHQFCVISLSAFGGSTCEFVERDDVPDDIAELLKEGQKK